jgi:hypothetical protein
MLRNAPLPSSDQGIHRLARWHLGTMFWKYGDHALKDCSISHSGKIEIVGSQNFKLFCEILALACEIVNTPSTYRRLAKGASMRLGTAGELITTLPVNVEVSGTFYDRRRGRVGAPLSEIGFAIPVRECQGAWMPGVSLDREGNVVESDSWPPLFFEENSFEPGSIKYQCGGFEGFEDPNYMRSSWVLTDWESLLVCFEPALFCQTGLRLSEMSACFRSLNNLLVANLQGHRGVSCHSLGVLALPRSELEKNMISFLNKYLTGSAPGDPSRVLERFLKLLEHDAGALDQYDFFTWHSAGVLLPFGDMTVLDLCQISQKFTQVVRSLQLGPEMRTVKGGTFETVVASQIEKYCRGISFPIPQSQELYREGSNNPFAEVDVYISKGDVLFLVDCKACCVSRRYLKGEPPQVAHRWAKVQDWIRESDRRARAIALRPIGDNYAIPDSCRCIVPIVCSSFPEYFFDLSEEMLLTESIPRVCTLPELLEVLNRCEALNLSQKPYAVAISHPPRRS